MTDDTSRSGNMYPSWSHPGFGWVHVCPYLSVQHDIVFVFFFYWFIVFFYHFVVMSGCIQNYCP